MGKVLFIGLVWPEPQSSAAGTRMLQLLGLLQDAGYEIVFASAAAKSAYSFPLASLGVQEEPICLNDSRFDNFVAELQPAMVVFDRFMTEEQYGWRVREQVPSALTILDTEDLHFLRKAREEAYKKGQQPNYHNPTALREIAAILRCDVSLIISRDEMELLTHTFQVSKGLLYYLPFLEEVAAANKLAESSTLPFAQRKDFVFIGNFLHEPNWKTVQVLKNQIWPELKKHLPEAELHIYGAYVSDKVQQLHQPKDRFFIQGRAADARETIAKYRVLLAPIPFGAGAKGKFVDAMQVGTPSVSSVVGAESMSLAGRWNGFISDDPATFVQQAVLLYSDITTWQQAQAEGYVLMADLYDKTKFEKPFLDRLIQLKEDLQSHRRQHFMGQILQTQQHNSTKFMSLWIEEKNKSKGH